MALQQLSTVLATTWILSGAFGLPIGSQLQREIPIAQKQSTLPDPPKTPPDNRTQPGGGLDAERPSCQKLDETLWALIPVKNPVETISEYPTLLFYVPDVSENVQYGEFSISRRDERTRIGKIRFKLPQTPGIVSVRLPELPEYALSAGETGEYYHWYLNLYCQEADDSTPRLSVDGWMRRVASRSEWKKLVDEASPKLWYDSLAKLAERLRASPQDRALREQWVKLLGEIGAEDLSDKELLGPVVLEE